MLQGKWIWIDEKNRKDDYINFFDSFDYEGERDVRVDISCDGNYLLFINGEVVSFGQYHDYPHYKVFDRINITSYLKKGRNVMALTVWYSGVSSYSYTYATAGVVYEIFSKEKVYCYSHAGVLCNRSTEYVPFQCKIYTAQIGLSFCYDSRAYIGFGKEDFIPNGFCGAVEIDKVSELYLRPIERLLLLPTSVGILCNKKGVYDLGCERVGLVHLSVKAKKGAKITFIFGEYIQEDGNLFRSFDGNDFSFDFIANGEFFEYKNYFRRFGCRYIQIVCSNPVEIDFIGLMETPYPTKQIPFDTNDNLVKDIYQVAVRTLELCRHEHYEDCPWREQALYTLDSRNQMLCGYYAFDEGYKYAKSCLELISRSTLNRGLLKHTFPCDIESTIPIYSLYYILELYEYALHSGDYEYLGTKVDFIEQLLQTFENRREGGLLCEFEDCWNFYEFSDGLDGYHQIAPRESFSLILNCMYLIALKCMDKVYVALEQKEIHCLKIQELSRLIVDVFYNQELGLFRDFQGKSHYSVLGNAFAILAGVCEKEQDRVAKNMVERRNDLTDCTLCMKSFEYDALLKVDAKYGGWVLEDIKQKYGYMLSCGATSFWETLEGYKQYDGAGSLCHGWSAIPVVYFHRLGLNTIKEK